MTDENPETEETPSQPATTNLAPAEAAALMSSTVQNLRQQWLQSAVTVANSLRGGQTVSRGTFEDLKRLRENYEELERARIVLLKLNTAEDEETGTAG
jgi:hypothetical protein